MSDYLKINVRLSLKDLRACSFAKAYGGIFKKILPYFTLFLVFIFLFALINNLITPANTYNLMIVKNLSFVIPIYICISAFPFIKIYLAHKNNKNIYKTNCYELLADEIKISADNGSFSIHWDELYRLEETKPCFLIYSSPHKIYPIPKRCFANQAELDLFCKIITAKVNPKKLKLKRKRDENLNFSPDYNNKIISETVVPFFETENNTPLFEVSFVPSFNELFTTNLKIYYAQPTGVILSIIGILLLITYFTGSFTNQNNLIFGLSFTIFVPLIIYYQTSKNYTKDASLKKTYLYKFYSDSFLLEHPSGITIYKFKQLVRIKETNSEFIFFINKQVYHFIPKRVFAAQKETLESLSTLIQHLH